MDGQNNVSPELPLPTGNPENLTSSDEIIAAPTPEKKSTSIEGQLPSSIPAQQQIVNDQAQSQAQTLTQSLPVDPSLQATPTNPMVVDDVDVLEKEWVNRAKAIVDSTRDDPRLQKQELAKFKAEYIQHRFHKEVKQSENT
jgi:hypothetical protein